MTNGSVGKVVPDENARRSTSVAPTSWSPVVTLRLPIRRLARAEKTSSVPHDRAAASPVRSPRGIAGAYRRVSLDEPRSYGSGRGRDGLIAADPVLDFLAVGDVAQL